MASSPASGAARSGRAAPFLSVTAVRRNFCCPGLHLRRHTSYTRPCLRMFLLRVKPRGTFPGWCPAGGAPTPELPARATTDRPSQKATTVTFAMPKHRAPELRRSVGPVPCRGTVSPGHRTGAVGRSTRVCRGSSATSSRESQRRRHPPPGRSIPITDSAPGSRHQHLCHPSRLSGTLWVLRFRIPCTRGCGASLSYATLLTCTL